MADETGQAKAKAAMNGDWKKLMIQMYGLGGIFIVAIAVIWQTYLLPQLKEGTETTKELRQGIPQQTKVLEEIRDLSGKNNAENARFRQEVSEDHRVMNEALKTLCKESL